MWRLAYLHFTGDETDKWNRPMGRITVVLWTFLATACEGCAYLTCVTIQITDWLEAVQKRYGRFAVRQVTKEVFVHCIEGGGTGEIYKQSNGLTKA